MNLIAIAMLEVLVVGWLSVAWSRRSRGYTPDLPADWQPSRALLRQADRAMREIRG
jgi:hypothetical protein